MSFQLLSREAFLGRSSSVQLTDDQVAQLWMELSQASASFLADVSGDTYLTSDPVAYANEKA